MNECAWCRRSLIDKDGNPKFDLFSGAGPLIFVCQHGCIPTWLDPKPHRRRSIPALISV